MRTWHHLYLFYLATTFWALYFLGGLGSNYYLTWNWGASLLVVVLIPSAGCYWLCRSLLRGLLRKTAPTRATLWVAFYLTVPLVVYDLLYLGLHRGLGLSFLWTHWYLSALYVIPWAMVPFILARHDTARRLSPDTDLPGGSCDLGGRTDL